LDLTITQLSIMSTQPYSTYTPLAFDVVVHNPTTYPVNSLFWVDLYVDPSKQPVIAPNLRTELSVDYQAVGSLGGGNSITLTLQHDGVTTVGPHTYYALADTFDQVSESDEDNNVSSPLVITVTGVVTPTPTPTPTPTITPTVPGSISGITYLFTGVPQPQSRVDVSLIDDATGAVVATAESHHQSGNDPIPEGFFEFTNVTSDRFYRLSASYRQGNTDYCGQLAPFYLGSGVDLTDKDILLTPC
jgi:hypothetical protein